MRATLFLAGDVMTGRGIDQILPHPSDPRIYESFVGDAREYVKLAERVSGRINYPVSFDYIWGDALAEIERVKPDVRIINLETAITESENYVPKGIHYRMNPRNVRVLKTLGVDVCALANNHILDWGEEGLVETVNVLESSGIQSVGAGKNLNEVQKPAVFGMGKARIIVSAGAHPSSGALPTWQAQACRPGVHLVADLSGREIDRIRQDIEAVKRDMDFVVFSIHWGPNWGYSIEQEYIDFAHRLIDRAGVDLVFGHSSHHCKGFEIYNDRLIVYGAGDFINDYEGISGHEEFRGDLTLMYIPEMDLTSKQLVLLTLVPMHIHKFRLNYPSKEDVDWVLKVLRRESTLEGRLNLDSSGKGIEYSKNAMP